MSALANRRILVVEHEFVIPADLCEMLGAASAVVLGPAASIGEAMQLIQEHEVEAAILGMNLNGQ